MLITIVELPDFQKHSAKTLNAKERDDLLYYLSEHPASGDLIPGSGGVRKLRWKSKGKGKSGGSRIIYYYHNEEVPLFLLTMFSKNERVNISSSEKKDLSKLVKILVDNYKR